ncbi:hypothetical protein PVAND_003784 [Polypedilum vanderplanki]|uniref:Uncharacterized protein n=1 Tax=Polypedilum vanderplanki TaxID=319348 RepID=A0A9J6BV39_POLVA|nr:hypothetical protein PVAND_003784 [Polypedilum vanderplanki]
MSLYNFSMGMFLIFACANVIAREIKIEDLASDPKLKDNDYIDFGTLRVTKVKKNYYSISGNFEIKQNLGNEKKILLEIKSKTTGSLIYKREDLLCTFLQKENLIIPGLIQKSNIPTDVMTDLCPFPSGDYWIKNYTIDESKFLTAPIGNYNTKISLLERGKVLASISSNTYLTI